MAAGSIITLLTDFGDVDPYVGIMKGVILGIAPQARLVDLTHRIPPQDVDAGAYQLGTAWPHFPAGTVHLAVVDPGVGSSRLPLVVAVGGHLFVGPDNGLLESALAAPGARAFAATTARFHRAQVSATFHGRDVFAPVAAWLASGVDPQDVGPALPAPARRPAPTLVEEGDALRSVVVVRDGFGNLITAVPGEQARAWFASGARLEIGGAAIEGLSHTYTDVAEGALLALIGSTGRLEISQRGGSASERLGVGAGAQVRLVR